MSKLITRRNNVLLVRVTIPMAHMSAEYRVQFATQGPGNRVYISRGSAGGRSISINSVEILACGVDYWPESHFKQ